MIEGSQRRALFKFHILMHILLALTSAVDVGEGTALVVEHLLRTEETGYLDGSVLHRVGGMDNVLLVAYRVVATNGAWSSLTTIGHARHRTYHLYCLHTRDGHSHHW